MSRHRRPSKLARVLAQHGRHEADLRAMSEPKPGRTWCDRCGNRAGSAACVKACGGAR